MPMPVFVSVVHTKRRTGRLVSCEGVSRAYLDQCTLESLAGHGKGRSRA